MSKLTVVVTCSDRKTVAIDPALRVRNLPRGLDDRLDTWCELLRRSPTASTLSDLYCGENWVQVNRLMSAAATAGFDADLWVASAGLGLQRAQSRAPGYAATFSARHLDSVATDSCTAQEWWAGLQERRGENSLVELASTGPMLMVLGEDYTKALGDDLEELTRRNAQVLLFGGATGIASPHRIPANARLRNELKGTLSSLNTRTATQWLRQMGSDSLSPDLELRDWEAWVERVSRTERHNRLRRTDDEVESFIRAELANHPGLARTTMHTRFRSSNRACGSDRFARLYKRAKGKA